MGKGFKLQVPKNSLRTDFFLRLQFQLGAMKWQLLWTLSVNKLYYHFSPDKIKKKFYTKLYIYFFDLFPFNIETNSLFVIVIKHRFLLQLCFRLHFIKDCFKKVVFIEVVLLGSNVSVVYCMCHWRSHHVILHCRYVGSTDGRKT